MNYVEFCYYCFMLDISGVDEYEIWVMTCEIDMSTVYRILPFRGR